MDISQIAENFNNTFKVLISEDKELRQKISTKLAEKVEEIWPIVKVMKDNNVYFTHPGIDVKTLHGIIIGKNHKNYSEIYVCKEMSYVYKVNTHNDEIDGSSMLLQSFLSVANLDFAIKGIESITTQPAEIIDEIQRNIESEKIILQKLLW